jgi:allantoate deiminase
MVMGRLCPAGMLFVRCKGGISHNPLESITVEDCALGLAALTRFVRDFRIA